MHSMRVWGYVMLLVTGLLSLPLAQAGDNGFSEDLTATLQGCMDCHGPGGNSQIPMIPNIGGLPAEYLRAALGTFQDGLRPCPSMQLWTGQQAGEKTDMCAIASDLSYQDIDKIAEFFSAKPFIAVQQDFDSQLAKRGDHLHQVLCEECHTRGGKQPDADAGVLAGQWKPYLQAVFMDFQRGERRMIDDMAKNFEKLTEEDYQALINYYASQY